MVNARGLTRQQRDHLRTQIDTIKRGRLAQAKTNSAKGEINNERRRAQYRAYYYRNRQALLEYKREWGKRRPPRTALPKEKP